MLLCVAWWLLAKGQYADEKQILAHSRPSLCYRHQKTPTNQYFLLTGFLSVIAQQSPPSKLQPQLLQQTGRRFCYRSKSNQVINLLIDRMQLCSLVFVVTVAIAFVLWRTAFVFARVTFVFVAAIVFASVFGIQALALFAAKCRMTKFNTHIRQQFLAHCAPSYLNQQNPTNQYFLTTGFLSDFSQQSPPSYSQPQLLQGVTFDSSVTQTTTHVHVVKALTCFRRRSCHRLCISPHHKSLCSWGQTCVRSLIKHKSISSLIPPLLLP